VSAEAALGKPLRCLLTLACSLFQRAIALAGEMVDVATIDAVVTFGCAGHSSLRRWRTDIRPIHPQHLGGVLQEANVTSFAGCA
jgi:hypothetical protein